MEKITVIQLSDYSTHQTAQQAERHLTNLICGGLSIKTIDEMTRISKSTEMREYLLTNKRAIRNVLDLMDELKEVQKLT